MPRNKSEKLPRCPQAHRYADAVDAWLRGAPDDFHTWWSIPHDEQYKIVRADSGGTARDNRIRRRDFIREHYAA